METEEVLEELDLTDSEKEIYLSLLKSGEGTATELAKRSGVQRRLAYDVTDSLADKGLISYVDKENRRVYKPLSPENLRQLVEDRKREIEEKQRKLEEAMPQLEKYYDSSTDERDVKVMEGKEGVKQLFNDEVRVGETIYLLGSAVESEEMLEYFLPTWTEKRQEKGVKIKGVFENQMRGQVGEHEPIECRFLPEGYDSKVSITIYGEKVGIVFWIPNPLVILIEDGKAAESFKNYFDLVWENSKD
ncbi:MAG: TrmB family transcriptional regulator [Candidatus Nanohalobium sp.]